MAKPTAAPVRSWRNALVSKWKKFSWKYLATWNGTSAGAPEAAGSYWKHCLNSDSKHLAWPNTRLSYSFIGVLCSRVTVSMTRIKWACLCMVPFFNCPSLSDWSSFNKVSICSFFASKTISLFSSSNLSWVALARAKAAFNSTKSV